MIGNPDSEHSPTSRAHKSAFSLVEVVIALGILSFAVIAIVGMLPVAIKSAQESMRETDAILIAQSIFSELKTGSGGNRSICTDTNIGMQVINLTANNNTNIFLGFKEDGGVKGFTSSDAQNADLDFYAQIIVLTNTGVANLSRVQIDISTPAAAPPTARTTNSFITLIGF